MYKMHPFFWYLILGQKSAAYTRDCTVRRFCVKIFLFSCDDTQDNQQAYLQMSLHSKLGYLTQNQFWHGYRTWMSIWPGCRFCFGYRSDNYAALKVGIWPRYHSWSWYLALDKGACQVAVSNAHTQASNLDVKMFRFKVLPGRCCIRYLSACLQPSKCQMQMASSSGKQTNTLDHLFTRQCLSAHLTRDEHRMSLRECVALVIPRGRSFRSFTSAWAPQYVRHGRRGMSWTSTPLSVHLWPAALIWSRRPLDFGAASFQLRLVP